MRNPRSPPYVHKRGRPAALHLQVTAGVRVPHLRYNGLMTYTGVVKNGVIRLDEEAELPEGTVVRVEPLDEEKQAESLAAELMKLAGTAVDLPSDLAAQHDHYLHGQPKR